MGIAVLMQAPPQRERLAPEDREEARHRAELMRDRKRERERERRIDERGERCQLLCGSFWVGAMFCSQMLPLSGSRARWAAGQAVINKAKEMCRKRLI